MKRILLFAATNLAVVVLLGIIAQLLGVDQFLVGTGLNITSLLIFSVIFGMGEFGHFAADVEVGGKAVSGGPVIEQPRTQTEQWLVETVRRQAQAQGLACRKWRSTSSPEPNAFCHRRPTAIAPWSRSARACWSRCAPRKWKPYWVTRSATSPTATW